MAFRQGHGSGAGYPHIEVLPGDELPAGVPADVRPLIGVARRQNGTVATSEAGKALGSRGGHVKAKRVALARSLALGDLDDADAFKPYTRAASAFRRHHCAALALVAGGHCGAAPSSMIASAALQLAASRFLFTLAANASDPALFKQASQLANDSRQNLLAAHEIAVREAEVRERSAPASHHAALSAVLATVTPP